MTLVKPKKRGRPKTPPTPVQSDYMNVHELSKMIHLSPSHIYTLTSTKRIPYIKLLGKKLLFDRNEIQDWLTSKKVSVK